MKLNPTQIAGAVAAAASTGLGVFAGYKYASKRLTAQYEALAESEVAAAKEYYSEFYRKLTKADVPTPAAAVEELIPTDERQEIALKPEEVVVTEDVTEIKRDVVIDYAAIAAEARKLRTDAEEPNPGVTTVEITSDPVAGVTNLLVNGEPINRDDFDLDHEREIRRNGIPYVINLDEWHDTTDNHEKVTLTWFVNDSTLVDEDENTIPDTMAILGAEWMGRFGHGSGDADTVFVRNDMRGVDYEIMRSQESYIASVLGGLDDDDPASLQHSAEPMRRRGGRQVLGD